MQTLAKTDATQKKTAPVDGHTFLSQAYLHAAIRAIRSIHAGPTAQDEMQKVFRRDRRLFVMGGLETQLLESLRNQGFAVAPSFFSKDLIDRIYAKADALFHNLRVDYASAPRIKGQPAALGRASSYEELEIAEHTIQLSDPLVKIPEVLDIVFHESILKVVAHFFRQPPPLHRVAIVRDFPYSRPQYLSNFRRDNDDFDSLHILIDLVDIDDTRGPLVYVPGSNRQAAYRGHHSNASGQATHGHSLQDRDVENSTFPRNKWVVLRPERGSISLFPWKGHPQRVDMDFSRRR